MTSMNSDFPSSSQIDALISLLPQMEDSKAEWEIVEALNSGGFVTAFDWPAWQEEGRRYLDDGTLIDTADLTTLCRLYTLHVRKDRFCEGHFAAMLENGHIAAMTRRLNVIREEAAHGR
jgi:hypothetical protein